MKIDQREYLVKLNGSPDVVSAFNDLPVKVVNGSIVYMRDVAQIHDGYAVQTNIVRQDGLRATLVSVLKSGGASTRGHRQPGQGAAGADHARLPGGVGGASSFSISRCS